MIFDSKLFTLLVVICSTTSTLGLQCRFCQYCEDEGWAKLSEELFGKSNSDCKDHPEKIPLVDASLISTKLNSIHFNLSNFKLAIDTPQMSHIIQTVQNGGNVEIVGDIRDDVDVEYNCVTALIRVNGAIGVARWATSGSTNYNGRCSPDQQFQTSGYVGAERDCFCNDKDGCNSGIPTSFPDQPNSGKITNSLDFTIMLGIGLILMGFQKIYF